MAALADGSPVGVIGEALWQSQLKELPRPPWAPRLGFSALCAGKGRSGWRMLWILGGIDGSSRFTDHIWNSSDGGSTWDPFDGGRRWSPRSRMGVTVGSTIPGPGPSRRTSTVQGIVYVVGGQGPAGLLADVWASDTMCRSWHRMNAKAPFGPRADMACAVVPGSPLTLVAGGGVSSDAHQDIWLSRDAGETFVAVDAPALPRGAAFRLWAPDILCAARSAAPVRIAFWRLRVQEPSAPSANASAELRPLWDELAEDFLEGEAHSVPAPPRLALDLSAKVALAWDARRGCLAAHALPAQEEEEVGDPMLLPAVAAELGEDAHVLCDMDSVFVSLRRGFLWVLSGDGRVWASDRARYRAQDHFLKLLGLRLSDSRGMPMELWLGRVRPMLLPRPRQVATAAGQRLGKAAGPQGAWQRPVAA